MRNFPLLVALVITLGTIGCVKGVKPYEPTSTSSRTVFLPSHRTEGPAPVYARTRWTHPPEVLPARSTEDDAVNGAVAPIQPVYQLSIKNATLEDTAKVLGSMARYSSYVSPSLASLKFSFESLGTIDELAKVIEDKALIKVVVDHPHKEVRFLMRSTAEPTLYSE